MRLAALVPIMFCLLFTPIGAIAAEKGNSGWGGLDLSILSGFDLGLGGTLITSEYKDMSGDGTLLPLLGYEGDHVYLRGVAAGLHIFRSDMLEFNAQISYLPQHFYADDSDSWAMRRLDDRYSSLMAGLNGILRLPFGIISLTGSTDILAYSNGTIVDGNYTFPLRLGLVDLAPAIGVQWTDANYNRYYYGVDHGEALASGLSYYDPESAFSPYAQLSARVNFTDNWSAFASCRALFLNQEIQDSPMVDRSEKYSFSLGAMYKF